MNRRFAAAATALLLAACSTQPPTAETRHMNPITSPIKAASDYSAPELLDKMLEFIRTADTPEDFKAANVERIFGIKMENRDKEYPDEFSFGAVPINGTDWGWDIHTLDTFDTNVRGGGITVNHVRFGFFDWNKKLPFTQICQTDLERFHQRLLGELGLHYLYEEEWGGISKRTYTKDTNDNLFIVVFYERENRDNPDHKCVSGIHVSYGED